MNNSTGKFERFLDSIIDPKFLLLSSVSFLGSNLYYLSLQMQNNEYQNEASALNNWSKEILKPLFYALEPLGVHLSMTSFFFIFSVSGFSFWTLSILEKCYKNEKFRVFLQEKLNKDENEIAEMISKLRTVLVPAFFGFLNQFREIYLIPEYKDNPSADILLGWAAVLSLWLIIYGGNQLVKKLEEFEFENGEVAEES